jgi:hypothetical protein
LKLIVFFFAFLVCNSSSLSIWSHFANETNILSLRFRWNVLFEIHAMLLLSHKKAIVSLWNMHRSERIYQNLQYKWESAFSMDLKNTWTSSASCDGAEDFWMQEYIDQ